MRPKFRHLRRRVAVAGVAILGAGVALAAGVPAHAAAGCTVVYKVQSQWPGGFIGDISITNAGEAVSNWKLSYDFPDASQKVLNGWSGTYSQSGQTTTIDAPPWNQSLGTGASVSTGFQGSFGSANPVPTKFSLNGTTCNKAADPVPTVQITAPKANAKFTAPATIPITATASASGSNTITKVEFYHDGLLLNTDKEAPYAYNWAGVPAQKTPYHLQAIAYDSNGAKSETADVPVTVEDSPVPSIVASPTTLKVDIGKSASVALALSAKPAANVSVSIARATTGATTLSVPATPLTFTPANWDTAQSVPVKASDTAKKGDTAEFTASATGYTAAKFTVTVSDPKVVDPNERFLTLYSDLHSTTNGYFSPEGVPYHSIETLIDEAPDQGHETTSEAFSYWLWLEAEYGQVKGDWKPFNHAWDIMEKYIIPSHEDQPTNGAYSPSSPGTYAAEHPLPSDYPSELDSSVKAGSDPLAAELKSTYNTADIYGMHWLLDVDNVYGFGRCGDGVTKPAYINTFQRGTEESTWETVPQPSCDTFKHGGPNGYLDLFIKDKSYAKQWKYTAAPDADARAIQVAYWAYTWAKEQGKEAEIADTVAKAAKMGDYLRYGMYDKYFKAAGCTSKSCPAGTGKDSSNWLLNWYYAWGGAYDTAGGGWAWRIGSSHNHFGYQNPFAAYVLSTVPDLTPKSPTAKADWAKSLDRQLEFYQWLQSDEGGIAGGATNSWDGDYKAPPAGTPTFYGLSYVPHPVYSDPPSNQWFGFQAWSVERVAELYYVSGNPKAKAILDKWVPWALKNTTFKADGDYVIPSDMTWTGQPKTWDPANPKANTDLSVKIKSTGNDIGVAGSLAKVFAWYAAKSGDEASKTAAKKLIDGMWLHKDDKGVSVTETREDYKRFDDVYDASTGQGLYIPPGWSGKMPNGDVIKPGVSFLDIRSFYKKDPDFPKVEAYLKGGPAPKFNYHRFWAQADVATALADYARLFPEG